MADTGPDFRALFEGSPDVLLVLLPDSPRFTMVAATRSRLAVTMQTREETMGRGLFEVFPDNPDDPGASGTANLRASLERVLATRAPDTMAVQKYDIRGPDGSFQARHWSPKNIPVLSDAGDVAYILHRVEDVTELVRANEAGDELRDRTQAMEREVIARSRELASANRELREANAKATELDAAKTAFFSNISHEFRTPLTLMLGPLEDCLNDGTTLTASDLATNIRLAHANALRLYKLVNALLDFSRIEAGRMQAHYAPLDVGTFTAELAGMFHSAVDGTRVRLRIDCPPLREKPWVDREMWEKIVPNLISNAFKFTHEGEIGVRIVEELADVILEVADTGIGIPEAEVPLIFERFHRVQGQAGRTYEGTGIGLALVHELVTLHGGQVTVDSVHGRGTTFRVRIPKGFAHLPERAVSHVPVDESGTTRGAAAYASEASHWAKGGEEATLLSPTAVPSPSAPATESIHRASKGSRGKILIVDDNADLRRYVENLLRPHYDITTACDGADGLAALERSLPDLVLSDVMMPRLDGVGMLRAIRSTPSTASLPVILLSARAGEEAAIEGLDAGADDYLVKPFSARELLARVRTHLEIARARREWIAQLEDANRELDAFSYSVSHDLRAPLRAIDGFSRALVDSYTASLDERGKDYLGRIRRAVQRMGSLIDGLLDLSRVTRGGLREDVVDLTAIAANAIADLRRAAPDRLVRVDIEPDLIVRGDQRLLEAALVNLIGNAWKFTAPVAAAGIELKRPPTSSDTFVLRDNGVGFDAAKADHIFTPFRRFHAASDFPGTGIGLATVARIIGRHGGRIHVEAAVGAGAAFIFSLPLDRRPEPEEGGPDS